jgi:predicted RNA methylase
MAQFNDIDPGGTDVSDDMISKVGTAVGQIAEIQQNYGPRVAAAESDDERQDLQKEATIAAVKAISNQGLTVEQYNDVVVAAQADPTLEQRLLDAANVH